MTDAPIAGWYPDPENGAAQWRWWDGRDWTPETAPRAGAPVVRRADWGWAEAPPAPTAAAPSTNANTPWIWILAFSLYVWAFVAGLGQGIVYSLLPRTDPNFTLFGAAALVIGLIPLWIFADLDGRALRKRGFPAPSVLWMLLLPPLVYFAVRARKLKRASARSKGPEIALLIVVALQILAGIAGGLFAYSIFQTFISGSPASG